MNKNINRHLWEEKAKQPVDMKNTQTRKWRSENYNSNEHLMYIHKNRKN